MLALTTRPCWSSRGLTLLMCTVVLVLVACASGSSVFARTFCTTTKLYSWLLPLLVTLEGFSWLPAGKRSARVSGAAAARPDGIWRAEPVLSQSGVKVSGSTVSSGLLPQPHRGSEEQRLKLDSCFVRTLAAGRWWRPCAPAAATPPRSCTRPCHPLALTRAMSSPCTRNATSQRNSGTATKKSQLRRSQICAGVCVVPVS